MLKSYVFLHVLYVTYVYSKFYHDSIMPPSWEEAVRVRFTHFFSAEDTMSLPDQERLECRAAPAVSDAAILLCGSQNYESEELDSDLSLVSTRRVIAQRRHMMHCNRVPLGKVGSLKVG